MKITLNDRICFVAPTFLFANPLTAGILSRRLKKSGIHLSGKEIALIIKECKKYKIANSDWNILEIEGENSIKIKI